MQIKIDNRREYGLYVKGQVKEMLVSHKYKAGIRKLIMHAFDDSMKLQQGSLVVEVKD